MPKNPLPHLTPSWPGIAGSGGLKPCTQISVQPRSPTIARRAGRRDLGPVVSEADTAHDQPAEAPALNPPLAAQTLNRPAPPPLRWPAGVISSPFIAEMARHTCSESDLSHLSDSAAAVRHSGGRGSVDSSPRHQQPAAGHRHVRLQLGGRRVRSAEPHAVQPSGLSAPLTYLDLVNLPVQAYRRVDCRSGQACAGGEAREPGMRVMEAGKYRMVGDRASMKV